jgi:hypothetical protein
LRTCPEAPVGTAMCHVEVHRAAIIAILQDCLQRRDQIIRARVGHLLPKVCDPPSAAFACKESGQHTYGTNSLIQVVTKRGFNFRGHQFPHLHTEGSGVQMTCVRNARVL